jgi:uncharacterized membrane protein (DUF2068 family)
MQVTTQTRREVSDFAVIAIGVFKLVKSAILVALGSALIHWRHEDLGEMASHWIARLWLSRGYFDSVLVKLSLMSQETIDEFAIGSFIYSVMLLVEGVGLCLRKRWAEFLTVGITASLLPLEVYKLSQKLTISGVIVTLLNAAVVVYLIVRLFRDRRKRRGNGQAHTAAAS